MGALAFALVTSATLLTEFNTVDSKAQLLTGFNTVRACTPADIEALSACMSMFFTRRPLLQSTPPREDKGKARVLRSSEEITDAWKRIFQRRRMVQEDDRIPINNQKTLANMWTLWMRQWLRDELTKEQQKKEYFKQTSIFTAWVYQHFGGQHFVMAMWQTGITWSPTPELLNSNYNGALQHIAQHFASWTCRLARAVSRHKNDEATEEARTRSGKTYGKHGLTQAQVQDRQERDEARKNYYLTLALDMRLRAFKGKGQGKGKSKNKRGASEHTVRPKSWEQMNKHEQYWLNELYNGDLKRKLDAAEAKSHAVQAKPFFITDDD